MGTWEIEHNNNMKNILRTFSFIQVFAICFGQPQPCVTVDDKPCIFPFTYRGLEYNTCTTDNSETSTPWCATAVSGNGEVIINNWSNCRTDVRSTCSVTPGQGQGLPQQPQPPANSPTPCVTVGGPSSGKNCIFPFKHQGRTYNECTTYGLGQKWCSVEVDSKGVHKRGQGLYGLCGSSCPGGQDYCTPGSTWQVDCNTCTCTALHCTALHCTENPRVYK